MVKVDIRVGRELVKTVFVSVHESETPEQIVDRLKADIRVSLSESGGTWRPGDRIVVLPPKG